MTREALVEVMARAMLADELAVRPTLTFDPAWKQESDIWLSNANAALLALEAAGVRLVPSEATDEMLEHGRDEGVIRLAERWKAAELYSVLLAASPYKGQDQ